MRQPLKFTGKAFSRVFTCFFCINDALLLSRYKKIPFTRYCTMYSTLLAIAGFTSPPDPFPHFTRIAGLGIRSFAHCSFAQIK